MGASKGRYIPNRLKRHRRIMGYSQKRVAQLLGHKNTSTISRWEKGVSLPSVANLLKLSILYKTLSDQLYIDLLREYKVELEGKLKEEQQDATPSP